ACCSCGESRSTGRRCRPCSWPWRPPGPACARATGLACPPPTSTTCRRPCRPACRRSAPPPPRPAAPPTAPAAPPPASPATDLDDLPPPLQTGVQAVRLARALDSSDADSARGAATVIAGLWSAMPDGQAQGLAVMLATYAARAGDRALLAAWRPHCEGGL